MPELPASNRSAALSGARTHDNVIRWPISMSGRDAVPRRGDRRHDRVPCCSTTRHDWAFPSSQKPPGTVEARGRWRTGSGFCGRDRFAPT